MKTLIIDGIFVYKDLPSIYNNKTSLQIIYEKSLKNGFDRFVLLQNGKIKNIPSNIKNVIVSDFSVKNILSVIQKESKDTETVCIFNAGNPFYDADFINKLFSQHEKYLADYTYSLGYPNGLSPEIVQKEIIKELIELVKDSNEIKEDYLFYSISKDINSFDIETILSDFDLRIYRISFGLKDIGEEIFTKKMFDLFNDNFTVEKLTEYLNNNIDSIYTTIYCTILEITNNSPVKSIYLPESNEPDKIMEIDTAKKIIDQSLKENSEINFILGGIGEPLLHPDIIKIIKHITDNNAKVIIETTGYNSGIILNDSSIDKSKVVFVVKIDCYEETYAKIHTGFDFKSAVNAYQSLIQKGFKCYKSVTRMMENEIEIEKFIRNKETDNLIIRKFSTYCDMLSDKKVVDLSPIERIPCFHLRRELYAGPDGNIYTCMYSRFKKPIGNINVEDLKSIINKLNGLYINNAKKNYLDFCVNCDDYYIFNF